MNTPYPALELWKELDIPNDLILSYIKGTPLPDQPTCGRTMRALVALSLSLERFSTKSAQRRYDFFKAFRHWMDLIRSSALRAPVLGKPDAFEESCAAEWMACDEKSWLALGYTAIRLAGAFEHALRPSGTSMPPCRLDPRIPKRYLELDLASVPEGSAEPFRTIAMRVRRLKQIAIPNASAAAVAA